MAASRNSPANEKGQRRGKPRPPPLPPALRTLRNVGLAGMWGIAVLCGWHAGGGSWGGDAPGHFDLLSAALRGALVWLGLTTIWLGGFRLCQQIIQDAGAQAFGVQAFRRSDDNGDPPEHLNT